MLGLDAAGPPGRGADVRRLRRRQRRRRRPGDRRCPPGPGLHGHSRSLVLHLRRVSGTLRLGDAAGPARARGASSGGLSGPVRAVAALLRGGPEVRDADEPHGSGDPHGSAVVPAAGPEGPAAP